MKKLAFAAAMLAVNISHAAAQSIGGAYTVKGTNLDGSSYDGEAVITLVTDTTCSIVWTTGPTTSEGICSRNDNAFAAAYVMGEIFGLVIYKVGEDGTLDGLWTIQGKQGTGTEVLTPK